MNDKMKKELIVLGSILALYLAYEVYYTSTENKKRAIKAKALENLYDRTMKAFDMANTPEKVDLVNYLYQEELNRIMSW